MSSRNRTHTRSRQATRQSLSNARQRATPVVSVPPPQRITIGFELWKTELPAFASAVDEASNSLGTRVAVSATLAQEQATTLAVSAFGKLRAALGTVARDPNFVAASDQERE